jgi:hypothetical protein
VGKKRKKKKIEGGWEGEEEGNGEGRRDDGKETIRSN